ncbi:ion transport peptide isoform X2 [Cryptotermes secundus]|uniref:ion transport peptide isoform X2 n=1 Tax=Cryptotermes secundus TaxID=105785 RepID=UPI000CD7BC64|nr:ion transport peptide isoform X2 [Cryptotermes secundus]
MTMQQLQLTRMLACSLFVSMIIASLLTGPSSGLVLGHSLNKRSFFEIQCKGVYDKSIFARLDRICEDCYNLFREPQLHSLCRSKCFSSDYFKGCLEALLLKEEEQKFNQMVEYVGKK